MTWRFCVTREELENEIFISVIRDLLFFLFVNRARDPPCTTLIVRSNTINPSTCYYIVPDDDMSYPVMLYRTLMSYPVMQCRTRGCYIVPLCRTRWCYIVPLCRTRWCNVVPGDAMPYSVMQCRTRWCHIVKRPDAGEQHCQRGFFTRKGGKLTSRDMTCSSRRLLLHS